MQVVNVSVKCIRPGHADLKAWVEDKDNLYVGRGGVVFIAGERYPKESSPFANPFKIDRANDRSSVLRKYREYIYSRPDLVARLLAACAGKKRLGCWCAPEPCHADILVEIVSAHRASIG